MPWMNDQAFRGLQAFVAGIGPGDVLADRWELGESIGEGAMGVVHAARDRVTHEAVAVKICRERGDERFRREVSALATIAHPAIVRYIAHGVHADRSFVVMERLVGNTLASRLVRGALSVDETHVLGRRLADGLAAVHAQGIAHRDLKPSNVFLVSDDVASARIVDFGLARGHDAKAVTRTGQIVGTPGYMSPEQVRGERGVGLPADVFSLGCVLWECAAGRPVFEAEDDERLFLKILLEHSPLLETVVPSPILSPLIARMLDKEASRRPTMAAVVEALPGMASVARSPPTSSRELAPGIARGAVIGKYSVESLLGAGGMGVVLGARHRELGTRVALKLLHSGDAAARARFLREARAAPRLESAHVARVLDVGWSDDGAPYMVMEQLNGVDLADRLSTDGPIPIERAVTYLLETCEAIAEAHALGIIHRDLKPSNLFLTGRRDGTEAIKVLDFGISKITESQNDATHPLTQTDSKMIMGSIPYMSPEQLRASSDVDGRTDVWSLGVVLHELLTQTRPFEAPNPTAVAARVAGSPPTRLREALPRAPKGLEDVILRCLEKDRDERHPNLAAFARALEPFASAHARPSIDRVVRLLGTPVDERAVPTRWPEGAPVPTESAVSAKIRPRPVTRGRDLAFVLAALFGFGGVGYGLWTRATTRETPVSVASAPPPVAIAIDASSAAASAATVASSVTPPSTTPLAQRDVRVRAQPKTRPTPAPPRPATRPASSGEIDLQDPSLRGR